MSIGGREEEINEDEESSYLDHELIMAEMEAPVECSIHTLLEISDLEK